MIKRFFGGDIIRSPHSADMYFDREALCRITGVPPQTLDKMITRLKYESAKGLIFDGDIGARTLWAKYGIDALIGLVMSASSKSQKEQERFAQIIDFVSSHINNLCFDEFASLRGWLLPIRCRRAIMAHVCGINRYIDIPLKRIRVGAPYQGSYLRGGYHCTPENLAIPEAWISRADSTAVRALDLAVHLIHTYLLTDKGVEEILESLGIDPARGDYTDDDAKSLVEDLRQLML